MQAQEKEVAYKAAINPRFAVFDAERMSRENAARWSSQARGAAQTVVDLLDEAYACKGLHINYRKTFIAIKADAPLVKNRKTAAEVKAVFLEKGYEVIHSPQGIIVRIKKVG